MMYFGIPDSPTDPVDEGIVIPVTPEDTKEEKKD